MPWWRTAVIYQVYVRSFADTDGDGLGDLPGIRSRLPYLRRLGIDAIWLNPFYPSPQADAGYDVADYRDVDPRFGDLAQADGLIADAHALGLRVIFDIVPNHTSSDHPWFQEALVAAPGSRERARYLFRDGKGPDATEPPNDWRSNFGGPAWTRVVEPDGRLGQWYLHLFDRSQPDLDWMNDEVRAEFESVLRFWLDRDVDGFRIDVAHGLAKDPAMPDVAGRFERGPAPSGHPHWDQDEVHEVYRAWRRLIDSYAGERMFVGEIWLATPEQVARYVRPDELHTAFNFHFLLAPWDAAAMRAAVDESMHAIVAVGAPPTWVLSNHDVIRHVTRYGGDEVGRRRARAAALLMFALPGGAYVYQGEELGLNEVEDLPDEVRQDPTFRRTHGQRAGRDGCRVPIPRGGEAPPFAFGPGPSAWLPQPPAWRQLTAEAQDGDPTSMLELYRRALALRHRLRALGDGELDWIDVNSPLLAFRRQPGFTCVVNFGDQPATIPSELADGAEVLLSSEPLARPDELPPDTAVWLA
ncbi:MAG: glycoside hydrolase family 13 protein [Ilumatobacteraceae bacterium]